MKLLRHSKIREIVETQEIETQEELADALKSIGMDVTQATISRDIKDLMLIKVPSESGRNRYAFSLDQGMGISKIKLTRVFQENVIFMGYSENLIVIRTTEGSANYVAKPLDTLKWPEVLGTVAGDDTIMLVIKPIEKTAEVFARLEELRGQ